MVSHPRRHLFQIASKRLLIPTIDQILLGNSILSNRTCQPLDGNAIEMNTSKGKCSTYITLDLFSSEKLFLGRNNTEYIQNVHFWMHPKSFFKKKKPQGCDKWQLAFTLFLKQPLIHSQGDSFINTVLNIDRHTKSLASKVV